MKIIVIHSRTDYGTGTQDFPPVGTVGTIISNFDKYQECDVEFDGYPCLSTPMDPSWITHKSMIVFLDEDMTKQKSEVIFAM